MMFYKKKKIRIPRELWMGLNITCTLIRFHVVNTEDIENQWEEIYIQCG